MFIIRCDMKDVMCFLKLISDYDNMVYTVSNGYYTFDKNEDDTTTSEIRIIDLGTQIINYYQLYNNIIDNVVLTVDPDCKKPFTVEVDGKSTTLFDGSNPPTYGEFINN